MRWNISRKIPLIFNDKSIFFLDSECLYVSEVHAGQACVAQCSQDNKWYRCQVMNTEDNGKVEVMNHPWLILIYFTVELVFYDHSRPLDHLWSEFHAST